MAAQPAVVAPLTRLIRCSSGRGVSTSLGQRQRVWGVVVEDGVLYAAAALSLGGAGPVASEAYNRPFYEAYAMLGGMKQDVRACGR